MIVRSTNSPIAAMNREQRDPACGNERRGCRGLGQIGDHELRRRAGVRADRERECAAYRMPVDRDHAPHDQIPAFRQSLHRYVELVRIRSRTRGRAGRELARARVRDRHDGEPRLDGLAEDERDLLGRRVHEHARRRHGAKECRVRPGGGGRSERYRDDGRDDERASHRTTSVNGAVITRPSTRHWRNSRHVPASGTSTPTVSLPGVADVPVIFVAAERARTRRGARRADVRVEVVE